MYYRRLNLGREAFCLQPTTTSAVQKLLDNINPTKSAGLYNLTGKYFRDGASILAAPVSGLCNLSISLSVFPDDYQITAKNLQTDFPASINLKNHGKDNS